MCNFKSCFVVFVLFFLNVIKCQNVLQPGTDKLVTTSAGDIQGSLDSDGYYEFLGIPYGLVDEANPFGDSTPYPPFDDIFVASNDTVQCPQRNRNGIVSGSLDCLNLQVYVPATATTTSRLPVLIWVHGGYFMSGSSSKFNFGPKYLVRHDVIVVAINYRTGAYGFMCLGIETVPGNQGLKDQHLAFEWVQKNIEAFGGNPNNVTLGGISAGAHSLDLHLLSRRLKLYNKVILQSGNSLAGTVLYEPDRAAAIKIAQHLGLEAHTSREAVTQLAGYDVHLVVQAAHELNIIFKPCVEYEFEGGEPFITSDWLDDAPSNVEDIPVLIGFTEYERMTYHINKNSEYFENLDIFTERLNHTFDFNDASEGGGLESMVDLVRHFYLGDSTPSQDVVWSIINFDSDVVYIHSIQRTIKKYFAARAKNIFYYMFAYYGGRNARVDHNNQTIAGASHGDEISYLFESSHRADTQISVEDQLTIDRMTAMWTNFIKHGDPTPQTTALLPVKWTPMTEEVYHYMKIGSELTMGRRPINKRMTFWDLFYLKNDKYQRSYGPYIEENGNGGANVNLASFMTLFSVALVLFFRQ